MEKIDKLIEIARQAGKIILNHYDDDCAVEIKDDNSPVTIADVEADKFISAELAKILPEIPIISEEGNKQLSPDQQNGKFFLVDPLDGTKGFIKKTGQFTVNIGLIENKKPVAGVIYVPVADDMYWGIVGQGAWKNGEKIECSKVPDASLRVVASKSHRTPETDEYINKLDVAEIVPAASSLKFCLVAEGKADLYPRFGRTMEWDTAAGQAIVEAAGGTVENSEGTQFAYAKNEIFENGFFIARGRN